MYWTLLTMFVGWGCAEASKQEETTHFFSVSPAVPVEKDDNKMFIDALESFLRTKNDDLTENEYWLTSDFERYIYPYADIYYIERSGRGQGFYQPTLMQIIPTEEPTKKIMKIGFVGYDRTTGEQIIRCIYNVVGTKTDERVVFSRMLPYATRDWKKVQQESIEYYISPGKSFNKAEADEQVADIKKLCAFFEIPPIPITYYSCTNPKEVFEIKGFDYDPKMYISKTGGLVDYGQIVYSGNNSEKYTHEIAHIYSRHKFPNIYKLLDEGVATFIGGSGKKEYAWHRNKLKKYLETSDKTDLSSYLDPYERFYIDDETPVPYMVGALICEYILRHYGKNALFGLLAQDFEGKTALWQALSSFGLQDVNVHQKLVEELEFPSIRDSFFTID